MNKPASQLEGLDELFDLELLNALITAALFVCWCTHCLILLYRRLGVQAIL